MVCNESLLDTYNNECGNLKRINMGWFTLIKSMKTVFKCTAPYINTRFRWGVNLLIMYCVTTLHMKSLFPMHLINKPHKKNWGTLIWSNDKTLEGGVISHITHQLPTTKTGIINMSTIKSPLVQRPCRQIMKVSG